jgi:hypothetical protein
VVDSANHHWLIEGKRVGANPKEAVRAAIGQLMSYRHFIYREQGQPHPRLVALFRRAIGDAFTVLLGSLGIETIWQIPGAWVGACDHGAPSLLTSVTRATDVVW